ncbi:MAG: hypothetical protein AABY18_02355 [Candidatus Thermoplasmatota archaeon]
MAATTTIQVSKETVKRLSAMKIPGLTYDDVIRFALDRIPPEELRKLFSQWQEEAFAALLANPKVRRLN